MKTIVILAEALGFLDQALVLLAQALVFLVQTSKRCFQNEDFSFFF
jgi:hypothetical protein